MKYWDIVLRHISCRGRDRRFEIEKLEVVVTDCSETKDKWDDDDCWPGGAFAIDYDQDRNVHIRNDRTAARDPQV